MSSSKIMANSLDESVFDILSSSGNNDGTVILALLSDDERQNEWAFRQPEIGRILNDMFELASDDLAACDIVDDIVADQNLVLMLTKNDTAWDTCSRSAVMAAAAESFSPETILANGLSGKFYNVGDLIELTWNGEATPFRVVHKDYYTKGKVILCSENILTTSQWNSSVNNNYSSSTLRSLLNGSSILGKFSAAIQAAMTTPAVACHNKETAVTCSDKIFAPSYAEVGFGTNQYAPVEGSAWDYFTSNDLRIKKNAGTAKTWWLRSPHTNTTDCAWNVNSNGTAYNNGVNSSCGVVPCFEI